MFYLLNIGWRCWRTRCLPEPTAFCRLTLGLNHYTISSLGAESWKKVPGWTLVAQDRFFFLTHIVNVHSLLHCMILEFVHSASLTSEKFPCFPWPPWNSARLFLRLRWQQQCGLHGKPAVCNFPKSTWETEVIIWMNLEWWSLHAPRHVYFRPVFHASHCDRWCQGPNETGQIRERTVPRARLNDGGALLASPDLGHDTGAVGFGNRT